jgi:tetratricopeptide (TPR) repeat protein
VSYPVVEVLLNYTSLPNILKSADECFRTNRWESAAFYYRHALSRPHPQALTPYLCLQLACTYDRLYQQYPAPDLEKWRRYSLEILNRNSSASIALLEGDNPPDFTKVPSDDIEKQLRQAEMALARIEYNTAAILARQVIESSSSTPDTCHALRLLAYACLAMGEVKEAHQALTKLVDKANAAEPSERETFGLDILADEANLILERLQVQHEYECLYKDAMERVRNGDLQEGVRLLQRAAGILPKCPSVHYLLGNLYAQLGQQEKAKEHWDRALKLCAFDKLPKME